MGCRNYIVGAVAVALLMWGPLDHSWPVWWVIRFGYLIAIPVATWFFLGWLWGRWKPDAAAEDRLRRALAAATAGVFALGAVTMATADSHGDNTQWVQSREGMEAVGEDIEVPGPDWYIVMLLSFVAVSAFYMSVSAKAWEKS
jgi:hypothetical protein